MKRDDVMYKYHIDRARLKTGDDMLSLRAKHLIKTTSRAASPWMPPADPPKVIGIDDRAWRRNHRHAASSGTWKGSGSFVGRERTSWLAAHPTIAIAARDRGGGYGEGCSKGTAHF